MESKNELIIHEEKQIASYFTNGGMDNVLAEISNKVKEFAPDMTTGTGRKEIASMAAKVARSKTFIDGVGKTLVSQWKDKSKVVDAERKRVRESLDDMKNKVREPLTLWENLEKERIAKYKGIISTIEEKGMIILGSGEPKAFSELKENKIFLENLIIDEAYGEFYGVALQARRVSSSTVEAGIESIMAKIEARRRKEEEEESRAKKEQADREARAIAAAVAKEMEAAEIKAANEKAASERQRMEEAEAAEKKIRDAKKALEREKELAVIAKKEAQEKALRNKEAAERAIKKEKENAELIIKKAKEDADRIIKDALEKQKQDNAKKEELLRDKVHRTKVHNEIMEQFIDFDIFGDNKKENITSLVQSIANGELEHVRIVY